MPRTANRSPTTWRLCRSVHFDASHRYLAAPNRVDRDGLYAVSLPELRVPRSAPSTFYFPLSTFTRAPLPVATAQEQRQQNGADNRDDDRPETAAPGREERKHECDTRRLALRTRVARFRPEIAIDEFARESDCGQSKDPAKHDAKRSSENPPRDVCASPSFDPRTKNG